MMYDLMILGGGPAGYHAAEIAAKGGMSVLLIEKSGVGGVCLFEGCIPSKTLLNSVKILEAAKSGSVYGVEIPQEQISFNHKTVLERKDKVIKKLGMGIKAKLKTAGVTVIEGEGTILPGEGENHRLKVGEEVYSGKNLLIATGSKPYIPDIDGLRESLQNGFAVTNKGALEFKNVPESLVVLGGGVVGIEFASYYCTAGSKVTIILRRNKIAGSLDNEISDILRKNLEKKGVSVKVSNGFISICDGKVVYAENGVTTEIECEKVLLSVGRVAVSDNFSLDNLGVLLDDKGDIIVDDFMRTNVKNVYASGDVTGKHMLAHCAYRQSEVAVSHMLGLPEIIDYNSIASVTYSSPEVSSVGYSEEKCIEEQINYFKKVISLNFSGRYVAETERGDGICKLLFDSEKTLIGCHIIGSYASEIIMTAAILVQNKAKIDEITKYTFPHPSIVELIKEACLH